MQRVFTTIDQVADFCKCSSRTIARYQERGEMPPPLQEWGDKYKKAVYTEENLAALKTKIENRKTYS